MIIAFKMPNTLDKSRSTAQDPGRFMQHIAALSNVISEKKVHPRLIYNCDETMVDISDGKPPRVLTVREATINYRKTKGSIPAHITLVATIRYERDYIYSTYQF